MLKNITSHRRIVTAYSHIANASELITSIIAVSSKAVEEGARFAEFNPVGDALSSVADAPAVAVAVTPSAKAVL